MAKNIFQPRPVIDDHDDHMDEFETAHLEELNGYGKKRQLTVRFDSDIFSLIEEDAATERRCKADVVRNILWMHYKNCGKLE